MSLILPQYGDDARCLQDIDETDSTDRNILALVTRANEDASLELQSIFNGLINFDQTPVGELPLWFRQLAIELQTAYFWVKSNNTDQARTQREEVLKKARDTLQTRYAPTDVVGF